MAEIDQDRLLMFRQEFMNENRGMNLQQFVALFMTVMGQEGKDRVYTIELVDAVIHLFKDIDINGDGRLEWEEFNQYIIDEVISNSHVENILEEAALHSKHVKKEETDRDIVRRVYAESAKNFVQVGKPNEHLFFPNSLAKVIDCGRSELLVFLEHESDHVKVLDKKFKEKGEIRCVDVKQVRHLRQLSLPSRTRKNTSLVNLIAGIVRQNFTSESTKLKTMILDFCYLKTYMQVHFS